jgi:hypothetical protein
MYIPNVKIYFIEDDPFSYSHKKNKFYLLLNENIKNGNCYILRFPKTLQIKYLICKMYLIFVK